MKRYLLILGLLFISVQLFGQNRFFWSHNAVCPTSTVTDVDGNVYHTVAIGSQCWMKENLATTKYNDGTSIPNVTNNAAWVALATSAYSWYNNDAATNKATYGALYNWFAVDNNPASKMVSNGGKNICPTGWHVPSHAQWGILENYLVANGYNYDGSTSGSLLTKSMGPNTYWNDGGAGTIGHADYPAYQNKSGFTGLPAGMRREDTGVTDYKGLWGLWWSSNQFDGTPSNAFECLINSVSSSVTFYASSKTRGYAVRCIKNTTDQPTDANAGPDIIAPCGVITATLGGNTPSRGTGKWSVVSGTATITDPANPLSGVTGLAMPGTAILRWTISNPPWLASTDDMTITTGLTVNHVSGSVAPVTKTVNYGTVSTTLAGTGEKCWIIQNLGADHAATSANDGTPESAGWFWQFNQKQGYVPNSIISISSISESSNWLAANDPCTQELGAAWRIPTQSEWSNANSTGGWSDYNSTYASSLKIHPAGLLFNNNSAWYYGGSFGYYWSSTQYNLTNGYALHFGSNFSSATNNFDKAIAYPVRCLMDCSNPPTTANAGEDIVTACGARTATLAGNTPVVGTGQWSVVSGTATITTPGSPTSGVTGLAMPGTATLRWTISNPPCSPSTDDVVITTGMTVNHVAGVVAPVTKPVNYGTVVTFLSGASKCWITQNLGADHQAASATDATEPSAGWYWQFNRKQGYKNNGTLTPAWTITSISENSDWLPSNDPCLLSLGTGWRIPSYSEWLSVDAAPQNWGNYTDTYNSVLKIHSGGLLFDTDGSLGNTGLTGNYWSSSQNSVGNGYELGFSATSCGMGTNYKARGMTLRCLRDDCSLTTTANAGADILGACGATSVSLAGNTPTIGTGQWSVVSGTATITSPGSPNSGVTGLTMPGTATLRWTISNGTCPASTDDVVITSGLTVNHLAGTVAPVTKTASYGTVLTSITGASKCWITQNLGADHQATSATDATEPSAGWYWQFNRIQGYKQDGVTVSPSWTITSITESGGWLPANDPCASGLGAGWRIPTITEWNGAISNGSWSNGSDMYNSVLKIHTAGYLDNANGSLNYRGSYGYYWSSSSIGNFAYSPFFNYAWIQIATGYPRACGLPLRCLKDDCSLTSTANAGADIVTSCAGTTATLAGNTPAVGTGQWSVVSGTATITSPGSPTTGVTGMVFPGTATLRWSISTGSCPANTDDVLVTSGNTLSINHVAGTVAPVTKTVNYGTVVTSISGASKCWITQNLGSDHQATSATDATEPSAGWYWQFNRKQGYKKDGATRTPGPAWDTTNDNLSATWQSSKDPCTIELGSGWRVPTSTEWTNANGAPQSWASYNDTFNSVLKLHTAGYLDGTSGNLGYIGWLGYYWSANQSNASSGIYLKFDYGSSRMDSYYAKSFGFSIRCIKD